VRSSCEARHLQIRKAPNRVCKKSQVARASQIEDARRSLYHDVQLLLTELVPAIPLHENYSLTARKQQIKGVIRDTSHNTIVFTTVWLER